MSKQFLGVIAAIILVFVGVFALTSKKSDNGSGSTSASVTQHVQGASTASVTLVEYGDYQCPYCQQYYPTIKAAQEQFGDQMKFQFRNFPLQSVHPNAFAASRAAEAAGKQNKYWEMHDLLYENNDPNGSQGWVASSNPNTYFDQFAKQIGLNAEKFKTDFASSSVNDAINADITEGTKLKITGTPTFYLNGKKVQIDNTKEAFAKVIQAEIDKKKSSSTSTTESAGMTEQSTGTATPAQ